MRFHYSFFIVFILSIFFGFLPDWFYAFGVVILHECVHLFFSFLYKEKVKKITIYGFGVSIRLDNHSFYKDYIKEMIMCLSAPIFNIIFGIILYKFNNVQSLYLAKLNFLIGIINLLPILPLDGGRAYRAYVCEKHGVTRGYKKSIMLSKIMLFFLFSFGIYAVLFYFNLSIILIIAFLIINIIFEEKQINLFKYKNSFYSKKKLKIYRLTKIITASADFLAVSLLKEFSINKYYLICVVGPKITWLTETDIYNAVLQSGVRIKLCDI